MLSKCMNFMDQVKQEFKKITWSSKKQAMSITGMVFVMVAITALYFFLLDWMLSEIVSFLLNIGS